MVTPFLGELRTFAGNFAPRNWALANGQLMNISQNAALFSLLGTTYGGNGIQTFALPNLQGTLAISQGQGPGLSPYTLGERLGTENVTLLQGNMPIHSHTFNATTAAATTGTVGNTVLPAAPPMTNARLYVTAGGSPPPTPTQLNASVCGTAGGSQPHSNMMPALVITYIIALSGIFPSRN